MNTDGNAAQRQITGYIGQAETEAKKNGTTIFRTMNGEPNQYQELANNEDGKFGADFFEWGGSKLSTKKHFAGAVIWRSVEEDHREFVMCSLEEFATLSEDQFTKHGKEWRNNYFASHPELHGAARFTLVSPNDDDGKEKKEEFLQAVRDNNYKNDLTQIGLLREAVREMYKEQKFAIKPTGFLEKGHFEKLNESQRRANIDATVLYIPTCGLFQCIRVPINLNRSESFEAFHTHLLVVKTPTDKKSKYGTAWKRDDVTRIIKAWQRVFACSGSNLAKPEKQKREPVRRAAAQQLIPSPQFDEIRSQTAANLRLGQISSICSGMSLAANCIALFHSLVARETNSRFLLHVVNPKKNPTEDQLAAAVEAAVEKFKNNVIIIHAQNVFFPGNPMPLDSEEDVDAFLEALGIVIIAGTSQDENEQNVDGAEGDNNNDDEQQQLEETDEASEDEDSEEAAAQTKTPAKNNRAATKNNNNNNTQKTAGKETKKPVGKTGAKQVAARQTRGKAKVESDSDDDHN